MTPAERDQAIKEHLAAHEAKVLRRRKAARKCRQPKEKARPLRRSRQNARQQGTHAMTNPIPFPRPYMRHITLERLSGKFWATAGFLPGDPSAPWTWIQETVAEEYECDPDAVGILENEDGDLITADGLPVARVAIQPLPRYHS